MVARVLTSVFALLAAASGPPELSPAQDARRADAATADELLPDYDCIRDRGEPGVVDWRSWLAALEKDDGGGLMDKSLGHSQALLEEDLRGRAEAECPMGLLMADVLHALICYDQDGFGGEVGCYDLYEARVREALSRFGLRVLIGSRWPVADALQIFRHSRHAAEAARQARAAGLSCEGLEAPVLDWPSFREVFSQQDWYQPAVDVSYGPALETDWRGAAAECPLGFVTANFIKAMLCAHTESVCYATHEALLQELLVQIPLHLAEGSGWPVLWLLTHVPRAVRRHRFLLDFTPSELLTLPELGGPPKAAAAVSEAMADVLAARPRLMAGVEAAARGLAETDGAPAVELQLVYATMAYGERFAPYVGRFIARARALGLGEVLVAFCLDAAAFEECRSASGICIRGSPSILNKFTLPLVLLEQGFDVLWLDMDVFLFQSPAPYVQRQLREQGDVELLISGAFAVDCICSGIVFFRSVPRTRYWLAQLLVWMYEHPYEHDQKAVSAFLRAGERVAFDAALPVRPEETPRWSFLDPETRFVSARHVDDAGWTGDPDDIVAFHMLHGDSDETYASNQLAARNDLGAGYLPLLDLFFNRSDVPELYDTPALPHHLSEELREAIFRSRWPTPRPTSRGRCHETVPMRW